MTTYQIFIFVSDAGTKNAHNDKSKICLVVIVSFKTIFSRFVYLLFRNSVQKCDKVECLQGCICTGGDRIKRCIWNQNIVLNECERGEERRH